MATQTKPKPKAAPKTKIEAAHPGSKETKTRTTKAKGKPTQYKDSFDPGEFENKGKTAKPAKGNGPPKAPDTGFSSLRLIAVDLIDHNPLNARTEAEIEADPATDELAASLGPNGPEQPISVRAVDGGRFVVVFGCRRRVACKRKGIKFVQCLVRNSDDNSALVARLLENLQRQDLTPVQEAKELHALQQALKLTQQEVAAKCGKGQAFVSMRLSLLKLPEGLQELINSGHLSNTRGRELATLSDVAAVMADLVKQLTFFVRESNEGRKQGEDQINIDDDAFDNALGAAVEGNLGCMIDDYRGPLFKPNPKQLKQLDVRTVTFTGGVKEQWAVNKPFWDELQAAAQAERDKANAKPAKATRANETAAAEAAEQAEAAEKHNEQHTANVSPGKAATTATTTETVETISPEELAKREEKARLIYCKRLYRYLVEWLQLKLSQRLESLTDEQLLHVLLTLLIVGHDDQHRRERFTIALKAITGKKLTTGVDSLRARWNDVLTIDRKKLRPVIVAFLQQWAAAEAKTFGTDANPALILSLCSELGINFTTQWTVDRAFLNLHTTEQLWDLVAEWKLSKPAQSVAGKGPLVDWLESLKNLSLPKCLAKLKPVDLD